MDEEEEGVVDEGEAEGVEGEVDGLMIVTEVRLVTWFPKHSLLRNVHFVCVALVRQPPPPTHTHRRLIVLFFSFLLPLSALLICVFVFWPKYNNSDMEHEGDWGECTACESSCGADVCSFHNGAASLSPAHPLGEAMSFMKHTRLRPHALICAQAMAARQRFGVGWMLHGTRVHVRDGQGGGGEAAREKGRRTSRQQMHTRVCAVCCVCCVCACLCLCVSVSVSV